MGFGRIKSSSFMVILYLLRHRPTNVIAYVINLNEDNFLFKSLGCWNSKLITLFGLLSEFLNVKVTIEMTIKIGFYDHVL